MVPEGRKGIHPAGCRLPVCDTHYRNDCVFSLITHYFYAERRLNEGKKKNNSNNTSREQLTHTQNTLLFVWNSTVCKRRPVNTPLHSVSHVCVVAPSSEILSHLAVVLFSGLFVTEEEHAARPPASAWASRPSRRPTRLEAGATACACSEPGVTNDIFFSVKEKNTALPCTRQERLHRGPFSPSLLLMTI